VPTVPVVLMMPVVPTVPVVLMMPVVPTVPVAPTISGRKLG
jgi:hypothetical protein